MPALLNQTIPYYDQLISMLSIGRTRPNIPEYPMIAEDIRQAIEQIYNGTKEPKEALGEADNKIRQSTRMVKAIRSAFFHI